MTPHIIQGRGSRRFFLNNEAALSYFIGEPIHPPQLAITTNWSSSVVANGGTLNSSTLTAINTFWTSLQTAGLDTLMYYVNIMAPDSLIACMTPLTSSNNQWLSQNNNFVSADLSVNGLLGIDSQASAGKWILPLLSGSVFATGNAGMSAYINYASNSAQYFIAGNDGEGSTRFGLLYPSGGNALFDCWNCCTPSIGRLTIATAPLGMYICTRPSSTDQAVFIGKSGSFITGSSASGQAGIGSPPIAPIWIFGVPQNNGTFTAGTRMSFFAYHQGLTFAQSQNFFNAVQTLRTSLGGGYI